METPNDPPPPLRLWFSSLLFRKGERSLSVLGPFHPLHKSIIPLSLSSLSLWSHLLLSARVRLQGLSFIVRGQQKVRHWPGIIAGKIKDSDFSRSEKKLFTPT